MPKGDRTGPRGEGPLTGRQLGYGGGFKTPGFAKGGGGGWRHGFFGRGRFGRGFGRGYFGREQDDLHDETEIDELKSEVKDLKSNLNTILERLEALSSAKDEKVAKS